MAWAGAVAVGLLLVQEPISDPGQGLPVSLDKIRKAIAERPAKPLIPPPVEPTFRVTISERRFQELLDLIDYWSGPVPPGGLYRFEQGQRQGNPWAGQPLVQFNVLPVASGIGRAMSDARRARAERAARREVQQALIQFCQSGDCQAR